MNYLTLASMIRNEEHYVQEWLAFHYVQGFEQFILVLHQCEDGTEDRIRELPFFDKIRIHKVVCGTRKAQMSAFVWIAEHYGHTTEWLMFCDGDEYSFGEHTDDFREILEEYESFGGLFLNWLEFGHNRHRYRPSTLCIESYTKRAAKDSWWHASGKSIIKPKELQRPFAPASPNDCLGYSFISPHMFKTVKDTVHTDFTPISYRKWWCSEHICHDVGRCHHYRWRSLDDWFARSQRGNCNDGHIEYENDAHVERVWRQGGDWQVEDLAAVRFAKRVKEILGR